MTPRFNGRIVIWEREKSYGWLEAQGQRIFLHRRDFARQHKTPEVGDVISFSAGTDAKGRICAKEAEHVNDGGRFTTSHAILLCVLLVFPLLALARLTVDRRLVAAYAIVISIITYSIYAYDKNRARAKEWRMSESILHLFEALGGWPGAFVAQSRLRHKTSKRSYQAAFWAIVVLHEYLALDFLLEWKLSHAALEFLNL